MIKSSPGASRIHKERHFAAAASGGGARVSDANSYSNIGRGDVTKRLRWPDITKAIDGKLFQRFREIEEIFKRGLTSVLRPSSTSVQLPEPSDLKLGCHHLIVALDVSEVLHLVVEMQQSIRWPISETVI